MRENSTKLKMQAGQAAYGVISPTTDPTICEYLGFSGLDFYMIDSEHGAITPSDVSNLVRACELSGLTPLARVGDLNAKLILQYLDAGVAGIMMPGTQTIPDLEKLVEACKYPPLGNRGLGPVRAADYLAGKMNQAQYVAFANEHTLLLPQVEDLVCVNNLEELVKVEGIDGFIIGPRDLAMSMGFYDGPNHGEVKKVIDEVFKIVLGAGKLIGTVAGNAEQAQGLVAKGATLILNSVQGLLGTATKAFIGK
jgi:4-hydroxy-2-oxoheptanedioate aldolase